MIRPERQAILSLAPRLKSLRTEGGLICRLQEDGLRLSYLGVSSGPKALVPPATRPGSAERQPAIFLSFGGNWLNRIQAAVFGLCPDGEAAQPIPAGQFDGAVLIRPARFEERSDSQQSVPTPALTAVGLEPVAIIGQCLIFSRLSESETYLIVI